MPTALFVLMASMLLSPLVPFEITLFKPLEALDPGWRTLALLFIMIILTGLLYNLNMPIIRMYEGYPWQESPFGKRRIRHYQAQLKKARTRTAGLATLLDSLTEDNADSSLLWSFRDNLQQQLNEQLPNQEDLVLPTRLGNLMRSYEYYPEHQYGMDAVTLWPRLITVIDEKYSGPVDDAKASFDFMINSSVLSALLALLVLGVQLLYPTRMAHPEKWQLWLPWLLTVTVFAGLAWFFYEAAIIRAAARGALIKGAFDLYRQDLLKQLGYKRELPTHEAERATWRDISLQLIFGDKIGGSRIEYTVPSTSATSVTYSPADATIAIARGVQAARASGTLTVVIQVTNIDIEERTIVDLVVTDVVPEGYDYEWNSAEADGQKITTVIGLNPYQFTLPIDLASAAKRRGAPGTSIELTYRIRSRAALLAPPERERVAIWDRLERLFARDSHNP